MSLATPQYRLTPEEEESVYDPAEDTFLLLDALEKDAQVIRAARPMVVLEIGCGSGVVSTFAANMLDGPCCSLATDLNVLAAQCARRTASLNHASLDTVVGDLAAPLQDRLFGKVDLLLFNPPYVPTSTEEIAGCKEVGRAWAGGIDGREVLDRFLPTVPKLLSENGLFYLVALNKNGIDQLLKYFSDLRAEIVLQRRCGIEFLFVLKFWR
uniref:Methyltransferase HEMK2 n=1 Tax=Plectus sambesii TaxID=2011161 RepID=A0A914WC68_9BILA